MRHGWGLLASATALALACGGGTGTAPSGSGARSVEVRAATFNVRELSTTKLDTVDASGVGTDPQLRAAAEIVRRIRPDILLLQELDQDYRSPDDLALNARRFLDRYLGAPTAAASQPIAYPFLFTAPCNTGIPSGQDLDNDGHVVGAGQEGARGYGEDSFGFGTYRGQYAMAVLSRFPLNTAAARTFQHFLWKDLPDQHIPPGFYSSQAEAVLRLSSKSHWDLPVEIDGFTLHLWVSHPTPPVYDGPEDRNGRRNYDEIAFWLAYLDNDPALVDDAGQRGGRVDDQPFLILGDLNAEPLKGDAFAVDGRRAIQRLLADPRLQDTGALLTSKGALLDRDRPPETPGPPAYPERATAVFLGGMRIDYLLPATGLRVRDGGVFWPSPDEDAEGARLADLASDHRLTWIDLEIPATPPAEPGR
jgi:endonuclease/exonuclease/phosphatase family metal-dependent hydrolase